MAAMIPYSGYCAIPILIYKVIIFALSTKPYGHSFYVSIKYNVFQIYLQTFVNVAQTFHMAAPFKMAIIA